MIALLFAVVLSVVNSGTDWRILFAPHSLNVGVTVVTNCYDNGKLVFRAVSYVQVEATDSAIDTHRVTGIPHGSDCYASVDVQRNEKGALGDPDKDYSGEGATISWTEK